MWLYAPPDSRFPLSEATDEDKHYGYVNPENPAWLVVCGDDSRFMNFSERPNLVMHGKPTRDREASLFAAHAILAGQELTVGVDTDADSTRKLSQCELATK